MMQLNEPGALQVPPLLLEQEDFGQDQKCLLAWLKRHRPDAILSELPQARSLVEAAGYSVPGDLGLATLSVLDGNADAGIYQNPELIGKAALDVLIGLINRNERGPSPDHRTTTVKGQWVDGSTLPAKGAAPTGPRRAVCT